MFSFYTDLLLYASNPTFTIARFGDLSQVFELSGRVHTGHGREGVAPVSHHAVLHRLRLADFQKRTEFFDGGFSGDSIFRAQSILLSMLDEAVRPADAHHRRGQSQAVQLFQNGAAEPSPEYVVF